MAEQKDDQKENKLAPKKQIKYRIEVIQEQYAKQASDIINDGFTQRKEPVNFGANIRDLAVFAPFVEYVVNKAVETGYGNIAIEEVTNQVIGVVIGDDHLADIPENEVTKWIKIGNKNNANYELVFKILDSLNENYKEIKQQTNEWRMDHKFIYILSEATNAFSARQNEKIGFKIVDELYYEKWEYPKGSKKFPYAHVPKATGFHKACLMIYNLDKVN
eukprot:238167_1